MTTNITTVKRKATEVGGAVMVDTKNNSVKVWLQHGYRWKCNGQRCLEINFAPYHSKRLVIVSFTFEGFLVERSSCNLGL